MKYWYILLLFVPNFLYSQYCVSGGPSSTADSHLESLTFNGSTGSINYTGCPGLTGVEEYLSQTAFIDAGSSYGMTLQFGTCGGNFSGAGEAWIDFNGNEIFEPSESIGTWSGGIPTPASTFNFTVPAGSTTGSTRMRVMQREGGTLPLDPCEVFSWGSVTDFSIYVQNGVDCSGYIGDSQGDPRMINTLPFSESHNSSICYSNQNQVYSSPDVYYLVTPITVDHLNISLCGSSFDTFLSVVATDGTVLSVNDDFSSCGNSSQVNVNTTAHDSIYVIVEGWSNESGDYLINISESTASLTENTLSTIIASPNPTNGFFTLSGAFNGTAILYTSNGMQVHKTNIVPNEAVNVSHLPSGLYFLSLKNDNNSYTQKIILQ